MRKRAIAGAALASAMLLPFVANADPHPLQQQLQTQIDAAKAAQEDAENAKASKRLPLVGAHMQMLQQIIQQMQETTAQAGISAQEYAEWLTEDQHLIDQILEQMLKDQQLLIQAHK